MVHIMFYLLYYPEGVVSTLARTVKSCVLRLCPTKICFVIAEHGAVGNTSVWCELPQVKPFNG